MGKAFSLLEVCFGSRTYESTYRLDRRNKIIHKTLKPQIPIDPMFLRALILHPEFPLIKVELANRCLKRQVILIAREPVSIYYPFVG